MSSRKLLHNTIQSADNYGIHMYVLRAVGRNKSFQTYYITCFFCPIYLICPNNHALEKGGRMTKFVQVLIIMESICMYYLVLKKIGKTFNRSSNHEPQHLGFYCYCQVIKKESICMYSLLSKRRSRFIHTTSLVSFLIFDLSKSSCS